ncbi:unnamed protein product [Linum tenue]|uniref:CCHC-type domain-containing protein n=1 Tax=Linum tenue TaxID=586396 RepID=A0AAV0MZG5_9ROSI|nr:unnamed protein product [Linum tenue]
MIVWVQLPALKIHFYHKEVLMTLGNLIGRTIKLDYHTLKQERAKFARLAVEVDISKALVPRIWLDDEWQKVEYENLPEVCFHCGRIGHGSGTCPLNKPMEAPPLLSLSDGSTPASQAHTPDDQNPGFGPWMLVTRKSRRNPREDQKKGKSEQEVGNQKVKIMAKDGNRNIVVKEGQQTSPPMTSPNGQLPNQGSTQERKGSNGYKNGEEAKKGKEKGINKDSVKGKGLLGPGPKNNEISPSKQGAQIADGASSSVGPSEPVPMQQAASSSVGPGASSRPMTVPPSPPVLRTITGPNGTVMQIIDRPVQDKENRDPQGILSPSLSARTKRGKNKKTQQKRSPTKLISAKPLQIWSPVKERKPKSKGRLATLTLQEIHAWTEAAKRPVAGSSEKALEGQSGQDGAVDRPDEGVPV